MNSAEYYLPLKDDKEVPTLFYKWIEIRFNDGTKKNILHYLSTCGGGWMPSEENSKDVQKFIDEKLIKIERSN